MYRTDMNKIDEILKSKMNNYDKVKALNNVKGSIKQHRLEEANDTGKIVLPSALIFGTLFSIDHTMFDALTGKDISSISNINLAMFSAETLTGGASLLGILFLLETLENYITDIVEVNSYQRRLKPHK